MRKIIVIIAIVLAMVAATLMGLRMYTKSFSPEGVATYDTENIDIEVTYGRPYRKDRVIFGGLVPYDEVWRTGANEPTTFTTSIDLTVGGKKLTKGTYSLFTIPGRESWQIIFNEAVPGWGVGLTGEAARDAENDALTVEVPSIESKNIIEQFTISFEEVHDEIDMVLMWDKTLVVVPLKPAAL